MFLLKKKRGLSKDQISVMVALDRSGNIILEPVDRGKISSATIGRLSENKIDSDSISCTDSCRSFKKFARESNLELVQLPKGKKKEDIIKVRNLLVHAHTSHTISKTNQFILRNIGF